MHQPALSSTPTFCMELYFARMFDFYLFLNMNFACMLRPWTPKTASFCRNLLLCHFPAFSQLSLRSNPSFLWGNGLNDMCVSCLFTMLTKSEAFIRLLLLPKSWVVLERQADADKWHGVVFWIPYKMTIKINRGIPYKMDGPNPAKFLNCILSEITIW